MKKLVISSLLVLSSIAGSAFAAEITYSYPKRQNNYGQWDYIFVTATNGSQYCKEVKGGNSRMVDGEMFCGEDESSYNEYNWYQGQWVSKSTGSKNQCYPLLKKVTCN